MIAHLVFWTVSAIAMLSLGSLLRWNVGGMICGALCVLFWAIVLTLFGVL